MASVQGSKMSQMTIDFNEEGVKMTDEQQVEQVRSLLIFIRNASKVLSTRFTMLLALSLTFVLFLWALVTADPIRLLAAGVFAAMVFLPTVWLDVRERAVVTKEN
jgi:hypothetical protein